MWDWRDVRLCSEPWGGGGGGGGGGWDTREFAALRQPAVNRPSEPTLLGLLMWFGVGRAYGKVLLSLAERVHSEMFAAGPTHSVFRERAQWRHTRALKRKRAWHGEGG
jgi:hypothetical protein